MSDPDPTKIHADPLGELTRKERRNLLISSGFAFAVGYVGLVPTHIAFLGIEFSPISQRAFVILVGAVVVYFLFAFFIYGLSDLFAWRKRCYDYDKQVALEVLDWTLEKQQIEDEVYKGISDASWVYTRAKTLGYIRVLLFEFLLPILIAITSLIFVIIHKNT